MLRIFKQYYPIRNIFFVIGEGLMIFGSVILASWLKFESSPSFEDTLLTWKALLITVVCQTSLYYNELYDLNVADSLAELSIRLLQSLGFSAILLAGIYFLFPELIIGHGIFAVSIGFVIVLIVSWRLGYSKILTLGMFNKRIILVGFSELSRNIEKEIQDRKDCGYMIQAIVVNPKKIEGIPDDTPVKMIRREGFENLSEIAKAENVDKIVVTLEQRRGNFPTPELLKCRIDGIEVIEGSSFYEMLTGKLLVDHIKPAWLIFSEGFSKSRTRRFIKRASDLFLSILLMILLTPLMLILALLIKLDSRGLVIYSQERMGQNRRIYKIHKFRSMIQDAEKLSGPVWADEDDPRITRIGRWIRKWRIDELPQIWNVLKGEMSFVGPRPEREHFILQLEETIPYFRERLTVKPGVTGWAQVSYGYGANEQDAKEKLNYDLFYIKNMSIFMDLMILLRTVKIVLFGKGAR